MTMGTGGDNVRVLIPLFILILICTVMITITVELTHETIAENRKRTVLKVIDDIIPSPYDNDPLQEETTLLDPSVFGSTRPVSVYTARQGTRIQGFVFIPVLATGYSGPIKLAVGVHRDGSLSGVRVMEQHETRGLGDAVDQRQSDWIFGFRGRSFDNTPAERWDVRSDGGDFDRLSGATITSRGVINRVRDVLEYYHGNRQHLPGSKN